MYQLKIKLDNQPEITYCFKSYEDALNFKDKIQEAYEKNVSISDINQVNIKVTSEGCAG